jgi:CRP-like cAMP-binding protein
MSADVIITTRAPATFCRDLPAEYTKRIASAGQVREYPAGAYVFREGQSSAHVYLVAEGEVGLEVTLPGHEPARLQTAGPGELLGWSPVLGLGPMTASARTLTPCRLVALSADRIQELAREDPLFGIEFLRRTAVALAQRLNATRRQLLEASGNEPQAVS